MIDLANSLTPASPFFLG